MSATATARLGLIKPTPGTGEPVNVQTQINDSWDMIDETIGATICTNATRPSTPFQGQIILETDTSKVYVRNGSAWRQAFVDGSGFEANLPGGGGNAGMRLYTTGTASNNRAIGLRATSDLSEERWFVDYDGAMQWGPGNAGADTSLYRGGPGTLTTDDDFVVGGNLLVGGVIPGNSQVQVFTASGTWNKPDGAKRVWIRTVGGGGAGGGANAAGASAHTKGGGGGGGAYAERWMNGASITSSVTVTVGTGGAGVSAGAGNSGNASSFGTYVGAGGGDGGAAAGSSTATFSGAFGGAGGSTFSGSPDVSSAGGPGGYGYGSGQLAVSGAGGSSALGGGGTSLGNVSGAGSPSSVGNAGGSYGGGGGGAYSSNGGVARAGGAGAAGVVIVVTYF